MLAALLVSARPAPPCFGIILLMDLSFTVHLPACHLEKPLQFILLRCPPAAHCVPPMLPAVGTSGAPGWCAASRMPLWIACSSPMRPAGPCTCHSLQTARSGGRVCQRPMTAGQQRSNKVSFKDACSNGCQKGMCLSLRPAFLHMAQPCVLSTPRQQQAPARGAHVQAHHSGCPAACLPIPGPQPACKTFSSRRWVPPEPHLHKESRAAGSSGGGPASSSSIDLVKGCRKLCNAPGTVFAPLGSESAPATQ